MAVPKKKLSSRKRAQKTLHQKIETVSLTRCKECGRTHRTHFVCESCYK